MKSRAKQFGGDGNISLKENLTEYESKLKSLADGMGIDLHFVKGNRENTGKTNT